MLNTETTLFFPRSLCFKSVVASLSQRVQLILFFKFLLIACEALHMYHLFHAFIICKLGVIQQQYLLPVESELI